ncbi:hypothetical protein HK405_009899 [Cladochytrium tenue]|nr:hypothetical protein HK405_009899 [Cladochytrium tenue]
MEPLKTPQPADPTRPKSSRRNLSQQVQTDGYKNLHHSQLQHSRRNFDLEPGDRWAAAEVRFVELFYGPDPAFRARWRRHLAQRQRRQQRSPAASAATARDHGLAGCKSIDFCVPAEGDRTEAEDEQDDHIADQPSAHVAYSFRRPQAPASPTAPDCGKFPTDADCDEAVLCRLGLQDRRARRLAPAVSASATPAASGNTAAIAIAAELASSIAIGGGDPRIVRPRTADLSPRQRRRLRRHRVLDTVAFVGATGDGPRPAPVDDPGSGSGERGAVFSPRTRAGRLLLARASSGAVPAHPAATRRGGGGDHGANLDASFSGRGGTAGSRAGSAGPVDTATPPLDSRASSAQPFSAPTVLPFDVPTTGTYFVPIGRRRQQLTLPMRRLLAQVVRPHIPLAKAATRGFVPRSARLTPQVSAVGPLVVPGAHATASSQGDCVAPLRIPESLLDSLNDPRNRVAVSSVGLRAAATSPRAPMRPHAVAPSPLAAGRRGVKAKGTLVLRRLVDRYAIPQMPRLGGRVTPSKELLRRRSPGIEKRCTNTPISNLSASDSDGDYPSPKPVSASTSLCQHDDDFRKKSENSSAIPPPDLVSFEAKTHPENEIQGAFLPKEFTNISVPLLEDSQSFEASEFDPLANIGAIFPLDYFWEQDDITRHLKANRHFKSALPCKFTTSGTAPSEWRDGFVVASAVRTREFIVKPVVKDESSPHPEKTVKKIPLTRANILLPNKWSGRPFSKSNFHGLLHAHLVNLHAAHALRAEFEARVALHQLTGIMTPILAPDAPAPPMAMFLDAMRGAIRSSQAYPTTYASDGETSAAVRLSSPRRRRSAGRRAASSTLVSELVEEYYRAVSRTAILQSPAFAPLAAILRRRTAHDDGVQLVSRDRAIFPATAKAKIETALDIRLRSTLMEIRMLCGAFRFGDQEYESVLELLLPSRMAQIVQDMQRADSKDSALKSSGHMSNGRIFKLPVVFSRSVDVAIDENRNSDENPDDSIRITIDPVAPTLKTVLLDALLPWVDNDMILAHDPACQRLDCHASIRSLMEEFVDDSILALEGFIEDRNQLLKNWFSELHQYDSVIATEGLSLDRVTKLLVQVEIVRAHATRVFRDPFTAVIIREVSASASAEHMHVFVRGCFLVVTDAIWSLLEKSLAQWSRRALDQAELLLFAAWRDFCSLSAQLPVTAVRSPSDGDEIVGQDRDRFDFSEVAPVAYGGEAREVLDKLETAARTVQECVELLERHLHAPEDPEYIRASILTSKEQVLKILGSTRDVAKED